MMTVVVCARVENSSALSGGVLCSMLIIAPILSDNPLQQQPMI